MLKVAACGRRHKKEKDEWKKRRNKRVSDAVGGP